MGGCCATEKVEKQPIQSIIQNPVKEMEHNPVQLEKENGNSDLGANERPTNESKNSNILNVLPEDMVQKKEGNIHKDYKLLDPPLGKGGFGEVRKATHRHSGLTKAVKIIRKQELDEEEKERMINEVEILKAIDHPNVIKVFEFYEDDKNFYIVSELCVGGELFDRIVEQTYLSEKDAVNIMKQILSAVFYCHIKGIVHRDLKPENVLYETKKSDSNIKIIDFGTSRSFKGNEKMHAFYGTPYYIAPEVLKGEYNEKCDIWSCGVITYIMLAGYPPFNGNDENEIMEAVEKASYNFDSFEWENVTYEAKSFIKKLLDQNFDRRYSAEQALSDPWIKYGSNKTEVDRKVSTNVFSNLKKFRATNKLQNAVWVFLVSHLASNDDKKELMKTFKDIDVNGDGQLTRQELIVGYKKLFPQEDPEAEVDRILSLVDVNNSGVLDYSEFVVATMNKKNMLSKQKLEKAFKMFDTDGSGSISVSELKNAFQVKDEEKVRSLMADFDKNGDGEISFKEFHEMMSKLLLD